MTVFFHDNLPRLTVVMAVRNAADTVARALDSLALQHYPNLEVIVWDGVSTDGTLDVLSRYGSLISRLVSQPDEGVADAYNRTHLLATGDYVGLLNADDEFEPGMLWAVADAIVQHGHADVVSTGILYRRINRKGKRVACGYYAKEEQLELTLGNVLSDLPTFIASRFIRREFLLKVGPYTTDRSLCYLSNDREWMARVALMQCKNIIIPKALYGFLMHSQSMTSNPVAYLGIIDEHSSIAEALLKREDLSDAQRITIRRWQNRQLSYGFWKALATLKWDKAYTYARNGIAKSGWRWGASSLWLLGTKCVWKFGLMLSKALDRG